VVVVVVVTEVVVLDEEDDEALTSPFVNASQVTWHPYTFESDHVATSRSKPLSDMFCGVVFILWSFSTRTSCIEKK